MKSFKLDRKLAQLALLQRTELSTKLQKKIRKLFGRYLFSNFFSKYMIDVKKVSIDYYDVMYSEYLTIEKYINSKMNILSIGAGIGGLEVIINNNYKDQNFTFIERDFVTKKIKYGWDNKNEEAYNRLDLLENFLVTNNLDNKKFNIIDYDKNFIPNKKFHLITSLYSLDFHYNFEIYQDYLAKVSDDNTIIIFDTIRADYFKNLFEYVEIVKIDSNTLHKSKRIACRIFKK